MREETTTCKGCGVQGVIKLDLEINPKARHFRTFEPPDRWAMLSIDFYTFNPPRRFLAWLCPTCAKANSEKWGLVAA